MEEMEGGGVIRKGRKTRKNRGKGSTRERKWRREREKGGGEIER